MKKIFIIILLLVITAPAFPGSYKDWYDELPEKYKSPEEEQQYKDAYNAEQRVKNLPAKKGGTIDEYLTKRADIPAIDDLGWKTYPDAKITSPYTNEGFWVERWMLLDTMKIIYRWKVNPDGKIKAVNGKAIAVTK